MDRRLFLKILMLGSLYPLSVRSGQVERDENLVAILSDTHVGVRDDGRQRVGLARSIREVLAMRPLPGSLLILGDLAYREGLREDYELLREMLSPLQVAGIPWHCCMGNHDRRDSFVAVFPEQGQSLVEGHLVSLAETPHADFLMLDSLVEGRGGGVLGRRQEAWLSKFLSRRRKKVFLCSHHSLMELGIGGLVARHSCVAGYLNGHHHHWYPMLNFHGIRSWVLPSTGHWGDIGFTTMRLERKRAVLDLHLHGVQLAGQVTEEKERGRLARLQQLRNGVRRAVFPL